MKKRPNVKGLKYPLQIFKGKKIIVRLLDGNVIKGVLSLHSPYHIHLITNIGTDEAPEKGILVIKKQDICSVENNPNQIKHRNSKPKHPKNSTTIR
ncbi:hypothetical protein [Staphylococcus saprophyticus]|uniref:hypothetical protein n=1 Tax=Staphylococcus saprophyticus TaxID=29385 RepID=UPI0034C60359